MAMTRGRWAAFGRHAIIGDALLTLGVVLLAAVSIATSPSARGVAPAPDCSTLHGTNTASFETWYERWVIFWSDPSSLCYAGAAVLTGLAGTERLFAGTCRVLPVLSDWCPLMPPPHHPPSPPSL